MRSSSIVVALGGLAVAGLPGPSSMAQGIPNTHMPTSFSQPPMMDIGMRVAEMNSMQRLDRANRVNWMLSGGANTSPGWHRSSPQPSLMVMPGLGIDPREYHQRRRQLIAQHRQWRQEMNRMLRGR